MSTWYMHEWRCMHCGKVVKKKTTREFESTPQSNGCRDNPNRKGGPHIFEKTQTVKV